MIEIAIVDDREEERARIRECLDYLTKTEGIEFGITEFSTGMAFIGNYRPEYDIVFMDIEMPGMNGIDTARDLRRLDPGVILIFVTDMAQYAIQGYEVEALDYILKPINKFSFAIKVRRAVARTVKRNDEYIQIRTEGETYSVRIAAIKYLEVTGHYVIFHTTDGDYTEYTTLKEAYARINREYFVHCSRSYLVNLKHVTSVNRDKVTVGEDELIISRPQKKAFLSALSDFMGGRR